MPGWRRVVPVLWSVLLAALALGPALGPGYVLSYDMVWVPDLALRPDVLGVGSGLPQSGPLRRRRGRARRDRSGHAAAEGWCCSGPWPAEASGYCGSRLGSR